MSATVGAAIGGGTLAHFNAALTGLAGYGNVQRLGGDKNHILDMNYEYLTSSLKDLGSPGNTHLDSLGLNDKEKYKNEYLKWLESEQKDKNLEKFWLGKPSEQGGLGYYRVPGLVGSVLHPIKTSKDMVRQEVGRQTAQTILDLSSSNPSYSDVPIDVRGDQYEFHRKFIIYNTNKRINELSKELRDKSLSSTDRAKKESERDFLRNIISEHRAEQKQAKNDINQINNDLKDPSITDSERSELLDEKNRLEIAINEFNAKKSANPNYQSYISQLSSSLKEKFVPKNTLISGFDKLKKIKKELDKAAKDPIGYVITYPFHYFWVHYLKEKIKQLLIRVLGKRAAYYLLSLFNGGLSRLTLNTAKRLGSLAGRGLKALARPMPGVIKEISVEVWKSTRKSGLVSRAALALKQSVSNIASRFRRAVIKKIVVRIGAALSSFLLVDTPVGWVIDAIIVAFIIAAAIVFFIVIILAPGFGRNPQTAQASCGLPPSTVQMTSQKLFSFIQDAAKKTCVPASLILAIMKREGSKAFTYTDDEYTLFSTPGWQDCALLGNTQCLSQRLRGYCFENESYAMGVMQFIPSTFAGYAPEVERALGHKPAHRCNIQDSIYASALKLKANSGTDPTNCTNWDELTVRKVAGLYCGNQCIDQEQACGVDYCGGVYTHYLDYQKAGIPNCSPVGTGGNPAIAQAMLSLNDCTYYPDQCGSMVNVALARAGYKFIPGENAFNFYPNAGPLGYNTFFPTSQDQFVPGDLVVWNGGPSGHIGIVISHVGSFVNVRSNLNCGGPPTTPFRFVDNNLVGVGLGSQTYKLLGIIRATDAAKR
jgi:hypothetical protein